MQQGTASEPMDDATFLQQCGIEVDRQWLMECLFREVPPEAEVYGKSLLRILGLTI